MKGPAFTLPKEVAALGLELGRLYIVAGFASPLPLRFEGWRQHRCQMHGDLIGWHGLFIKVHANGRLGNTGLLFDPLHTGIACWIGPCPGS